MQVGLAKVIGWKLVVIQDYYLEKHSPLRKALERPQSLHLVLQFVCVKQNMVEAGVAKRSSPSSHGGVQSWTQHAVHRISQNNCELQCRVKVVIVEDFDPQMSHLLSKMS